MPLSSPPPALPPAPPRPSAPCSDAAVRIPRQRSAAGTAESGRAPWRSLRHTGMRWWSAANLVSNAGTWMQLTVQNLLVLQLSGSAALTGLSLALQVAPGLLLGLAGGAAVDRWPLKRTAALSQLAVEDWWGERPVALWVARRLHDYSHLRHEKGPGVRPWLLRGRVCGHGPDNEALLAEVQPVAWVPEAVIAEAERVVAGQDAHWGPLSRWR